MMPIEFIDDVPFKHALPGAALASAKQLIHQSRIETKARLQALRTAIAAKDEGAEAEKRDWLLTSSGALLTSAVEANKNLMPKKRQTLEACLEAPAGIDFEKPFAEIVPVYPKAKKAGGVRAIHNPRLLHRTAQHAIARVMGAYVKPRPFQFTQLGLHKAIARTKTLLKAGYVYTDRLDVKDFYSSFHQEALSPELPLLEGVVANAVVGRHMEVVKDQEKRYSLQSSSILPLTQTLLYQARLGIPHGSGCSPIIGMHCVSRLVWAPSPGVMLVNYADDFLVLTKSAQLRDEAVGKLTEAVADLPGGHFELKLKSKSTAAKGIEFLGHHLQIIDGALRTRPMNTNLNYLYLRLDALDTKLGTLMNSPGQFDTAFRCLAQMLAIRRGWASAFRECDDLEMQWLLVIDEGLKANCKQLHVSMDDVAKAIQPWMVGEGDYALGL